MDYPCSICLRNVVVNAFFGNCCNQWTHRKCANLTIAELDIFFILRRTGFVRIALYFYFHLVRLQMMNLYTYQWGFMVI